MSRFSNENEKSNPLRVLIVGGGNIAGRFDQGRPFDDWPYSHAGAYARDRRYRIAACVEPDENRRNEFMAEWEVPVGFRAIEEVSDFGNHFDVISICSPTQCHAHDIKIALRLNPQLIFCEKPVTTSFIETERLVAECRRNNVLLAVNYSRRFDPDVAKLHEDIKNEKFGQLRTVVGIYNKGILNNGSHMLDLLNLLLGPLKIKNVGVPIDDFFSNDPTVPVWLEAANGLPIQLACGYGRDYTIFELQFVFSQMVLTMEEGGMFWRERQAKDSSVFKGYRVLNDGVRRVGKYPHTMQRAVSNIADSINHGKPLVSTGESAIVTQLICEQIKHKACQ